MKSRHVLMAGGAGLLLVAAGAASLNRTRTDPGPEIDRLTATVTEREAEIERLNQSLAERQEEVDRLTTTLAVRDKVLASLNAAASDRDAELDTLKTRLADAQSELETLRGELETESARLAEPSVADAPTLTLVSDLPASDPKIAIFAPDPAPTALAAFPGDPGEIDRVFAASSAPPPLPATDSASVEVHFDFASASLSPGGQAYAAAAAVALSGQPLERIRVVGHTDRIGSPAANRRLAEKRARAVADFLVAAGLSADLIEIAAMGEADPPVATDDGVAEPLNRSVAIVPVPTPVS